MTTAGKTKAARKPARTIQIFTGDVRNRLIAVKSASSLKQALVEYHKETLAPLGWTKPLVNGNVLTTSKGDDLATYVAKDVSK